MNKKRIALALAAGLSINALVVTVAPIGGQATVAHATQSRVTPGSEDEKKLSTISVKSLDTDIQFTSAGDVELSFKNLNKDNIKDVKVSSQFEHSIFTERTGIDSKSTSVINSGTWDVNAGKFKLNGKFDQPGIYTGKIEIEFKDGVKEIYTVTVRKTPSDSITFDTVVGVGTIEVSNVVLNNGVGNTTYTISDVAIKSKNGSYVVPKSSTGGKFVFSALDLVDGGKLSEGDVFEVQFKYGTNKEYTSTGYVTLVKQATPEIKEAFATNSTTAASTLETSFRANFGDSGLVVDVTKNSAGGQATANGKTVVDFRQTYNGNVVGGAQLGVSYTAADVTLSVAVAPTTVSTAENFVNAITVDYGNNNPLPNTGGLIGDYYLSVDGDTTQYIYADGLASNLSPIMRTNATGNAWLAFNDGSTNVTIPSTLTLVSPLQDVKVSVDTSKHGYQSVGITFGVNGTNDKSAIDVVNKQITDYVANPPQQNGTKHLAKVTDNSSPVDASVIVVTDALDGVASQVKFEKTSVSEALVTVIGGRNLVGTNADINTIKLNVSGATTSISGTQTGSDLVFKVQFNGQVPSEFDWALQVGNTNKLNGKIDATQGSLEVADLTKAGVTNSGTENINDQFRVEAIFDSVIPNADKAVIEVDKLGSDRVTFAQLTSGEHTVSTKIGTGKYQGTYSAGIWVTQQPMAVQITKAESTTQGIANITVDATFFGAKDNENVKSAKVEYREKTDANNGSWSSIALTKEEIKEDAIVKSISNLSPNKTYEFRAVYEYNNGTKVETITSNTVNVVISNNTSGNSGIVSGGSGSTTTGNSVGSTTITSTSSNTTSDSDTVNITLPSGVNYDSTKTPVAVKFIYKGLDGKTVTENKEQYSNVTVKFENGKVVVDGLVPGKDYPEISVDYTDNNGRTRTLVLKDVKTTATSDVDKYLADVYTTVLKRPADEAGYHFHLKNLKDKKVSLRDFLKNMLSEKEFNEYYKTPETKVEALYTAIVARESDQAGKDFWVEEYKKAVTTYGSEALALQAIVDRMVNEPELKTLAEKMNVQW